MSRFDLFFVVVDDCNEVSDYNIARHITKIHRFQDDAVEPSFNTQQLQRYIKFARTLTPTITKEAQRRMVSEYRKLRQSDASSLSKSSYRITVRQLESMIRLSEALARLHCDDEIKEEYVVEACRLLRKSIVQVQSEDLELDDPDFDDGALESSQSPDDDDNDDNDDDDDNAGVRTAKSGASVGPASSASQSSEADRSPKKHVSISYEKYTKIATMIIRHLRKLESRADDEAEAAEAIDGSKMEEVVTWYLETQEEMLDGEAELEEEAKIVRLVLHRMIHVDGVVLELADAMVDEDEQEAPEADKYLVVHPNYVDEE